MKKCTRIKVKGGEDLGHGPAKEMWAILKDLRENCRCKLTLCPCIRVLPSEGQRESAWRGAVKKASFRSRIVKQEVVGGMLGGRCRVLTAE